MAICLRWLACLIAVLIAHASVNAQAAPTHFQTIEAARSSWDAEAPPASGWRAVTLPDDWSTRWPGFDGVVWYRLTWDQRGAARPTALMLEYWTLAGAVYLNEAPIARDARLTEPLSRSWNMPRRWLLSPPALREGSNVLLIRVSGFARYQAGLGPVALGDPATVEARYDSAHLLRRVLPTFNLGITVALATFFFAIWLMRRRETAYGWYSLALLAWAGYSINLVATSPWPFATTDGWSRATLIALLLFAVSYCMFVIRFLERRFPRIEAALWTGCVASLVLMAVVPHHQIGTASILLSSAVLALYFGAAFLLFALTWRGRRVDHWVMNATHALTMAAATHDQLTFTGVLRDNIYYAPVTSQLLIVCMAIVLAWKFVSAVTRVEQFNDELTEKVGAARQELADMLNHQHELRLASSRMAERMSLAHNLHDGMGATLVNNIAVLEHGARNIPAGRFLSILKELREELRLVIDTSTGAQPTDRPLADWLAPLRARLTLLCEDRSIQCRWRLDELGDYVLPAAHSLDIMRVVQEGLTNALKHSGARAVDIALQPCSAGLALTIEDDGHGFNPEEARNRGIGLQSMASRASRLGGTLDIRASREGTALTFRIPHIAAPDIFNDKSTRST